MDVARGDNCDQFKPPGSIEDIQKLKDAVEASYVERRVYGLYILLRKIQRLPSRGWKEREEKTRREYEFLPHARP
uniref:Uncharacterized protein n=1 Tax=Trichobilharzia regenti TaxID=157069 RepID=A0AA85JBD8_TRIRE|nr:unnamed protein product [Trichobilharzia regenti]